MTEYPLVKIEKDAQLLVTTNVNSPISLQGVCQCSISDSSGKRKAYLVMYGEVSPP